MNQLTDRERAAVCTSIRSSIDLYRRYVQLRAEDARMARKQGQKRKALIELASALGKLKDRSWT